MAIVVTNLGTNSNTAGATLGLTLGTSVPAGSEIIVCISDTSSSIVGGSVADNGGANTYSSVGGIDLNGLTTNGFVEVFHVSNAALASGKVITYTKAVTGSKANISAFYVTGTATSGAIYGFGSASGNSRFPSVTSGSSITSGDLVVGLTSGLATGATTQDSTNGAYAVPPTGSNPGGGVLMLFGGNVVSGSSVTKTYAPTFTNSVVWGDLIFGIAAAGGVVATVKQLSAMGVG